MLPVVTFPENSYAKEVHKPFPLPLRRQLEGCLYATFPVQISTGLKNHPMTQDPKALVDTMLDAQKGIVDTMVENTKRFAGSNTALNETVEKGSEWYKNWLEGQKAFFGQTTQKATEATEAVKETADKAKETFQNWMGHSNAWGRQLYDMNLGWMKAMMPGQPAAANPMEAATQAWTNAMGQWQKAMKLAASR